MPSIDERVVSMAFENAKFEAGVATTMATLARLNAELGKVGNISGFDAIEAKITKLNDALAKAGAVNGFSKIEGDANKVTLNAPLTALEKLKAKFGSSIPVDAFDKITSAAGRVSLAGPMAAFDKLKAKFGSGVGEANKTFSDIEKASQQADLQAPSKALDQVTAKFGALQVAGVAALGTLASRATTLATDLVKTLTGAQTLIDGFSDYELKIGSTQTIMAGTGESIDVVSKHLKDLDTYADRTIYNLRDMTGNIGKFTNAGVKLPVAVGAMKGIANLAALSGANTEEAARSMYNLGQAIGTGTVRMADWRSVDLANMGTKEFKEQLIDAALAMGKLKKGNDGTIRSLKGNEVNFKTFGKTLEDQWLTSEALTKTLNKYADETTNLGKRAYAAASDVKTFSMMMTTLAAGAGTGWTDTFEILIGNLPEATKLWTGVTNAIGGFIGKSAEMRNKVLKDWKDLGGRGLLLETLKKAFSNLGAVLKPIGDAFRDIFPRKTGEDLLKMTQGFAELVDKLKPSEQTIDNIRRIFAGLFAVLHTGWTVVKLVAGVIFDLLGVVTKGSGGVLSFAASIGDFLVAIDNAVSKGGALNGVFKSLTAVLKVPLQLIKDLVSYIGQLFGVGDPEAGARLADAFREMTEGAGPLAKVAEMVQTAWENMMAGLKKVADFLEPFVDAFVQGVVEIRNFLKQALDEILSDKGINIAQTGLLAGIFVMIRKGLKSLDVTIGGDVIDNLNDSFRALTGTLTAMQAQIHAAAIATIAAAIALLAASIVLISNVDSDALKRALTSIAVGLAELGAAILVMGRLATGSFAVLPMAAAFVVLAGAMILLGAAMHILGRLSWEDMAKGLVGIGGALASLGIGLLFINPLQLIGIAAPLVLVAFGMNLLAAAVTQFGSLKWEQLAKGIVGVGGSLVALGMGLMFINPLTIAAIAPGLLVTAVALNLLAAAVGHFGQLSLEELGKGLAAIGIAVVALGIGISFIPPTAAASAAGVLVLAIAMNVLAGAVALFGNMKLSTLAKGLGAMGVALGLLGVALYFMIGTLPGSAALLAAAVAMAVLVPSIALLGSLPWGVILKGLAAMAVILGVLAVAGLIVAAPLGALGAALLVLGQAMALISVSVLIFAKAMQVLSVVGTKGLVVLGASIVAVIALIPKLIKDFVLGMVAVLEEVVKLLPKVVVAVGQIIDALLQIIIEASPKLAIAAGVLITALLKVLVDNVPKIMEAGSKLLSAFMTSIQAHLPQIAKQATDIIVKFMTTLQEHLPKIIEQGTKTIVGFISGITSKFPILVLTVANMVNKFLFEVQKRIPRIIASGTEVVVKFIGGISKMIGEVIKAGVRLILEFLEGVNKAIPKILTKALKVAETFVRGVAKGTVKLVDIGFQAVIDFLNGTAAAIRKRSPELRAAGWNVASALIDGMKAGIQEMGQKVLDALGELVKLMPKRVRKLLGIESPSKVFAEIGRFTMLGLAGGIDDGAGAVDTSVTSAAKSAIDKAKDAFSKIPVLDLMDVNPVITPVLDLSQLEKDAQKMSEMTNVVPITAAASYGQATAISDEAAVAADAAADAVTQNVVNYEQNNYSPEALSQIEIYRQTNNQLGKLRSALGLP